MLTNEAGEVRASYDRVLIISENRFFCPTEGYRRIPEHVVVAALVVDFSCSR